VEAPKLEDNSDETSPGNSGTGTNWDENAKPKRSENPPAGVLKRMKEYGIKDPLEQAHFIAQISVESGQFQYTYELGDTKYLSKYNGRTDLGNTSPGDGPKYKGRGYMQLTGKANYKEYAAYLKGKGVKDWDVVTNPQWVETKYPADVSCYFWKVSGPKSVKKFSKKAAEGSSTTIINKIGAWINGKNPPNGASERITAFKKYWAILQSDPKKYS
jgi:predicted chitinase